MKAPLPGSERATVECAEERHQTKPARSSFSWKLLLLAVALGASIDAVGPDWLRHLFQSLHLADAGALGALAVALVTSVIVHEAGHFAAATLLDFELLSISLGPLRFEFWHGRVTFRLVRVLASGSVSAVPRTRRHWRQRMLAVIAAGPVVTALLGCSAAFLSNTANVGPWVREFLAALIQLNFFLFVLGLIPNGTKARVRNDARLFWVVLQDGEAAEEIRIWHELLQLELTGNRPRDYAAFTVRRLNPEGLSPNLAVLCARTIIENAYDRGDFATADYWDRHAVQLASRCESRVRDLALAGSAFLDVVWRADFDSARSKFFEVNLESLSPAYVMRRFRAAKYIALGDTASALAEIYEARQCLTRKLPRFVFEIELLERLHKTAMIHPVPLRLTASA